MSTTQRKFIALFAAVAFALGLGLMMAAPQTAHAEETKLTAGTTFGGARTLSLSSGGSVAKKADGVASKGDFIITARNLATFDTENDNQYYKFTTSNRNSTYRITVRKEDNDGRDLRVEIRDSKLRRFSYATNSATNLTYTASFSAANGQINRGETYYIELSRYIPESIIDDATIDRSPYVDYRISVEEIVPKPKAIGKNDFTFKVYTKSKKMVYTITRRSFYADGYQVQQYVPRFNRWIEFSFTGVKKTLSGDSVAQGINMGSAYWGYLGKIRPYRVVNGTKFYGNWTKVFTVFKSGLYVKCKKSYGSYVKGKYYSYAKVKKLSRKVKKTYFQWKSSKLVRYARAKKCTIVSS